MRQNQDYTIEQFEGNRRGDKSISLYSRLCNILIIEESGILKKVFEVITGNKNEITLITILILHNLIIFNHN